MSRWYGDPVSGLSGVCPVYTPDTMGEDADVCTECFHDRNDHEDAFVGLLTAAFYALEYLEANPDEYSDPRAASLRDAINKATGVTA